MIKNPSRIRSCGGSRHFQRLKSGHTTALHMLGACTGTTRRRRRRRVHSKMGRTRCFDCGEPANHEHHVVPVSLGGTKTIPLCERCHGLVHGVNLLHTRRLTKAALAAKRARGERAGEIPFGFTADAAGLLLAHEGEQSIIAIVQRYRAAGATLRAVVSELARRGLVSRTGRAFQLTQVARIAKATAAPTPRTGRASRPPSVHPGGRPLPPGEAHPRPALRPPRAPAARPRP